jgi:ParB-like nuclease family protein
VTQRRTEERTKTLNKFKFRENVKISDIDTCKVQPAGRTTENALKHLHTNCEATQLIAPPILQRQGLRWVCLDGHRRIEVAKLMGLDCLDCLVLEDASQKEVSKRFSAFNVSTRPLNGPARLQMWAKAPCSQRASILQTMNSVQAAQITSLFLYLEEEEIVTLILSGAKVASLGTCTTRLYKWAESISVALSMRDCALWLIEHGTSPVFVLERDYTSEKMHKFVQRVVEGKKPFSRRKMQKVA